MGRSGSLVMPLVLVLGLGSGACVDTAHEEDADTEGQAITTSSSTPYAGTGASLPGAIEAENFDNGGEGSAYHDTTAGNWGGVYRSTDVDIRSAPDVGGGWEITQFASGEWLAYTVNVTTSGTYSFSARVASMFTGTALHVEVDGVNVSGKLVVPNTGSWSTFGTVTKTGIGLTAGKHVVRIVSEVQWFDFNSFRFDLTSTPDAHPLVDLTTYYKFPTGLVSFPALGAVRATVRSGDHAVWDSNCDFAGVSGRTFPSGSTVHLDFNLRVEAGAAMPGSWVITGEIHNDDGALGRATSPPFSIHVDKDHMSIVAIAGGSSRSTDKWMWLYNDPNLLQRDHDYHITVDARFTSTGLLKVTRDGQTIVNYSGPLGYGTPVYWLPDIYRSASTETTTVDFSQMRVWTTP